jgi:hypothetical protein
VLETRNYLAILRGRAIRSTGSNLRYPESATLPKSGSIRVISRR